MRECEREREKKREGENKIKCDIFIIRGLTSCSSCVKPKSSYLYQLVPQCRNPNVYVKAAANRGGIANLQKSF